jgi:predicted metalloprotease
MRTPLLALAAGTLASLLFAGTASATPTQQSGPVPTGQTALVKNPIYSTGKLGLPSCDEQTYNRDDFDSARVYSEALIDCLNESWAPQFKKAGLPFAKPKFVPVRKPGFKTTCGKFPRGAAGLYCDNSKTIYVLLQGYLLSENTELFLFEVVAHEYGHHVQQLSGILNVENKIWDKLGTDAKKYAFHRKVELQAECFAGTFIGSVWHSLGRRDYDFGYVVDINRAQYDSLSHGKAKNFAYWLKKGFDAESPGACNTFAAPAARVS